MTGRQILERALAAHGITQPERVESHIQACDLSFAVEEKQLEIGFNFDIWVRDGGVPGKYAAPAGEDPARLGIMIERRHREVFMVQSEFRVTVSIAALFPAGRVEQVGGLGGGIPYLLPPDWQEKVERIL
jgi:hypothetical protein